MRPLIHPRMLERLQDGFFPSTVTIQQATDARGADGAVTQMWADLAGHVNLTCNVVPETSQSSQEIRRDDMTLQRSTHRVNLAAPYASITERMRAISGGVTYDVLLVTNDSQAVQTSLICERLQT